MNHHAGIPDTKYCCLESQAILSDGSVALENGPASSLSSLLMRDVSSAVMVMAMATIARAVSKM
jgi:hypothetical protein